MMKTIYLIIAILMAFSFGAWAQTGIYEVEGKVMDVNGELLIGVTVTVKNEPGFGVVSDIDGNFTIKKISKNSILVFSYIGFENFELLVTKDLLKQKIVLKESASELQEVVVTAAGQQRKISVVGAVTTVRPADLSSPSTSVTNMLGGRVPGIIAVSRSGEPGRDQSEFWIRGISTFGAGSSALVLIDGVEGNLNDIDPSDIESFTILKDASATAMYGVRGANGVVLVETHKGKAGKMNILIKSSVTFSHSAEMPEYVGAADYTKLANEARAVRDELPIYSEVALRMYEHGLDEDLYPNVDWRDEILKDHTWNHSHYFSASGGGAIARYFISAGVQSKTALYKTDESVNSGYNPNLLWNKYTFRTNIAANITKTTELSLGLDGTITKENAPGYDIHADNDLWRSQANLTPATVPLIYSNGQLPAYGPDGDQLSPYVMLNYTGHRKSNDNTTRIIFSLKQDLNSLVKGLTFNTSFSFQSYSGHVGVRSKMPASYLAIGRYADGSLATKRVVEPVTVAYSDVYSESTRDYKLYGTFNYNRSFDKHRLGGVLYYSMEDSQESDNDADVILSIPKRYQSISGRATYSYDDTYFLEGNLGYTGSENFKSGSQFGLFPAIAVGWLPSAYPFIADNFPFISHLKLRASYGEVGNDVIGGDSRFPYQSYVDENGSGKWGSNGLTEGQVGAENLRWEIAKKYNFGIDAKLFGDKIDITIDFFKDIRDDIFQEREQLPGEVGVVNLPYSNVGRMRSSGIDGTIAFNQPLGKEMFLTLRGNLTFAKNEVVHWDQSFTEYPYQMYTGYPNGVQRGLISMGLFADETEILKAPKQLYGDVRPGDIRYKDVNGDGVIDDDDIVPLSYSDVPLLQYGLAAEFSYKKWTMGVLFEGVSKVEYFQGGNGYYPFIWSNQGNILTSVADQSNRWTPASYSGDPSTENPNAKFPRLRYGGEYETNNSRNSTFWLADGKYIRLKNIDISYRWENKVFSQIGLQNLTIQAIAHNVKCWDKVEGIDAGQASDNGAVYPLQRTFSFQITAKF